MRGREATEVLRLRDIVKRFGSVQALDGACLSLAAGEIHGILGENGAGKTTLAHIASGIKAPDDGEILLAGRAVRFRAPADARLMGIALVHQHFSLVEAFTGLENIALFDAESWTRFGTAKEGLEARIRSLASSLALAAPLKTPVSELALGARQRIEILKALAARPSLLILDEPTAALAPHEIDGLMAALRKIAKNGTAIGLIAHKLDEVLAVADRVSVFRRGRRVLSAAARSVTAEKLASAMTGSKGTAARHPPRFARTPRETPLVAQLVRVSGAPAGRTPLRAVDLSVSRGEIVGIAGVDGNGQRSLAWCLAGIGPPSRGEARLPRKAGWIPRDRSTEGIVPEFTVAENVALALTTDERCRAGPWFRWGNVRRLARGVMDAMAVKAPGASTRADALSGGNQQRLVAGRELLRGGDLLIAESPTRGLDIRAQAQLRGRLRSLVERGDDAPGVVLISDDLEEVLELSSRVGVLSRGKLQWLAAEETSMESVGRLMLGAARDEAARAPVSG